VHLFIPNVSLLHEHSETYNYKKDQKTFFSRVVFMVFWHDLPNAFNRSIAKKNVCKKNTTKQATHLILLRGRNNYQRDIIQYK
jgi:hypothetical protein